MLRMEVLKVTIVPHHLVTSLTFVALVLMASLTMVTSSYDTCEQTTNGSMVYAACAGAASELVATKLNLTVEPEDYTCGVTGPMSYCTLAPTSECFKCNEENPHPPSAMTDMNITSGAVLDTWWNSITWEIYPKDLTINITASFNKTYELIDDVIILFTSPRPRSMIIYKSVDFGKTWTPLQYYNSTCDKVDKTLIDDAITKEKPDAVVCTGRYSDEVPYSKGEVRFSVNERYNLFLPKDDQTAKGQLYEALEKTNLTNFLQFTDIRIFLEKPNTDGAEALRKPENLIKYTYGIAAISIVGSCWCNLHGKYCKDDPAGGGKVCECMHNTEGRECTRCKPLYNNRPWKKGSYLPHPSGTANECQKCECNEHADSCVYNSTLGTGVCQNCTHNTTGKNCDKCFPEYHHNVSLPRTDPKTCVPCMCDRLGVKNNNMSCDDTGKCNCKPFVEGLKCDHCENGYYGLRLNSSLGSCISCGCKPDGTVNYNSTCDRENGQCDCKPHITGRICDQCKDGYYSFPGDGKDHTDCLPCGCDPGGSQSLACEKTSGQCICQVGLTGRKCDQALPGYYVPSVDAYTLQPLSGNCDRGTSMHQTPIPFTDRYYFTCISGQGQDTPTVHFQDIDGAWMTNAQLRWQYVPALRYSLNGTDPWSGRVEIAKVSNSAANLGRLQTLSRNTVDPSCPDNTGVVGMLNFPAIIPGQGKAAMASSNVTLDVRCVYSATLTLIAPNSVTQRRRRRQTTSASKSIVIDSMVIAPDYRQSKLMELTTSEPQKEIFKECFENNLALNTLSTPTSPCTTVNMAVGAELHNGANECGCDSKGSVDPQNCYFSGGQCECKTGVMGRTCNKCAPGFYNFSVTGCTPCNCAPSGSTSTVCNETTGQCPCRSNVATTGQLDTRYKTDDLQCRFCLKDHYGHSAGKGCLPCQCNTTGSVQSSCDDNGSCTCKPTIVGRACDTCQDGYFRFTAEGCSLCNCTTAGSMNASCNIETGQCYCKANVRGVKCELCNIGSFNMDASNPEGCQPCFCFGHGTTCTSAKGFKKKTISSNTADQWMTTNKEALLVPSLSSATMGSFFGQAGNAGFRIFPPEFNGNRLSSYNTDLKVGVTVPDYVAMDLGHHPLVILTGRGASVSFNTTGMNLTVATTELALRLHHLNWKINATSAPDAFTFLGILQDLKGIYVQQTFDGSGITILSGSLDTTELDPSATDPSATDPGAADPSDPLLDPSVTDPVTSVENCTCSADTNTGGQHCENCSQGFQRQNVNGSAYETCKACDCNTRGETNPPKCDMNTGVCLNCRNGTMGNQCEACAANVEGAECDTCSDTFWGLSKTGCQACGCSELGATDDVCNKTSGQCKCKSQVTGRQCDECADNHHNLTSSGCSECSGCYKLVFDEVTKLREVRDNLTSYVKMLESRDNNTRYGPFETRLVKLDTDMKTLRDFLSRADISESTIGVQINNLDATLKILEHNVTIDASQSMNISNNSINTAESYLEYIDTVKSQTNSTMWEVQKISGIVKAGQAVLAPLVVQLDRSAATVNTLSGGTIEKSKKVIEAVNEIEAAATTASGASGIAITTSTSSRVQHRETTQKITELKTLMDTQTSETADIQKSANEIRGNVIDLQSKSTMMGQNATTTSQKAYDINAMISTAQDYLINARSLSTQAENGTAAELRVLGEVSEARTSAVPAEQQTEELVASASQLLTRAETTFNQANSAKLQSTEVFLNASDMLNTVSNFQTQALAIESKANESLKQIPDVRSKNEKMKAEAQAIMSDLEFTKTHTDVTLQTLQPTSETADQLLQSMESAKNQSDQLAAAAAPILNNIKQKMEEVILTNQTKLVPLKVKYDSFGKMITALDGKSVSVQPIVNQADRQVNSNRHRIEAIVNTISNMRQLNATEVRKLREEIRTLSTVYDTQNFKPVIDALTQKKAEQAVWLETMQKKKAQLRDTVSRLRDIVTQLRVISGP